MDVKQVYNDLVSMKIGKVIENEPMYKHTTYKVGGPAKIFVKASDIDSLIQVLNYCRIIILNVWSSAMAAISYLVIKNMMVSLSQ